MLNRFTRNAPRQALTDDQIRAVCPSVFAVNAHHEVSARYSFMPTSEIVNGLRSAGWLPVQALECKTKKEHKKGFQKHILRFQHADQVGKIQEATPEIVLVNSHDRSSAYQLHAGIFRLVCSNGMVVADSTFSKVSVMHTGRAMDEIIDISAQVVEAAPKLLETVEEFKARELNDTEQLALATGAVVMRYDSLEDAPISPAMLLRPQRYDDNGKDLWRTLNRVQENIIRGGQKEYRRTMPDGKRASRTRAVSSITEDVRINKALWEMANVLKAGNLDAVLTA